MFERPHHQRIGKILHAFNAALLHETKCYFGGGTAIVLSLDEYRESLDIDFLCASNDGYQAAEILQIHFALWLKYQRGLR